MSEDDKKEEGKPQPVYAPPEQGIIPGYKKLIGAPKKDWRQWRNDRGEQIDSPPFRGPQFTGRIIPPLVDSHGRPIKDGPFQIVRDAKGVYRIVDWSLSALKPVAGESDEGDAKDDEGCTAPIMGRPVYETRHSFDRAKLAMSILARRKRDQEAGLSPDPVQCHDLAGVPIFVGKLVLVHYARGKFTGQFAVIDTACDIAAPKYRLVLKAGATLKQAVAVLVKESRSRKPAAKKITFVGPPISFEAPAGFGGFGGDHERECPTPDSKSWDVVVDLYARTGRWCRTAMMIWADRYPEELVEQCENYRAEYLADPSKFYDQPIEIEDDDRREKAESRSVVRDVLEVFEGSFVTNYVEEEA